MTREEALKYLDTIQTIGEQVDALEMAIEALKAEPCEDCISLEAVKNTMFMVQRTAFISDNEFHRTMDLLMRLPPVNPQPKTGRWIKTISENGITSAVRCSECGFEDNRYMLFRYCPNCGAKMIEPQESEDKECGKQC